MSCYLQSHSTCVVVYVLLSAAPQHMCSPVYLVSYSPSAHVLVLYVLLDAVPQHMCSPVYLVICSPTAHV